MINLKNQLVRWYFAFFLGAIVLYSVSCAPGALWQDSGLIQLRAWHGDIEGFFGLALSHPLFYILATGAKYIPLGEFGYRINLLSAIAGALAVANMFLLIRLWLGKNLPAVIAAVTLAVSHTFWQHASIAETYTLWTALFLAELIMLVQYTKTNRTKYLYWLGLFNGLAIAVHMLASITLLCYMFFFFSLLLTKKIRFRNLVIFIVFWTIGALPYEYLIIKNLIQTGDFAGTLASAAFGDRWQGAVLNTSLSLKIVKENLMYIFYNFPTPTVLLILIGCYGLFKLPVSKVMRNFILSLTILFFIFAFRYNVPDRYAFFIPFYCMAAILIGLGVYLLTERINSKALIPLLLILSFLPAGVYAAAPAMAKKMQINIVTRKDIAYRDDYKYFLQPWKTGYRGPEKFADEALSAVENNAVIYADITTAAPLLYAQQVKGKRPDVKIISGTINTPDSPKLTEQTIEQILKEKAVYVVSTKPEYCPEFILSNYATVRDGILWRVIGNIDSNEQQSCSIR